MNYLFINKQQYNHKKHIIVVIKKCFELKMNSRRHCIMKNSTSKTG